MKFLCEHCKAKYQIADDKVAGRTVRMKCRKCGNQIEVRAAVTETSVAMKAGDVGGGDEASAAPVRPAPAAPSGGPPRPAAPLAGKAPAPRTASGSLAGAFQRNVRSEEEAAPGLDLRELSAADEWYVAVNGVPVGPVRVGEVRRKAATGAVTEDSLCWQEGMEEWRAIRTVTELAAVVREAAAGGRPSQAPGFTSPQTGAPSVSPRPPSAPRAPNAPAAPRTGSSPNVPAWGKPAAAPTPQYRPMDADDDAMPTLVGRSPLLDEPEPPAAPRGPLPSSALHSPAKTPMAAAALSGGTNGAANGHGAMAQHAPVAAPLPAAFGGPAGFPSADPFKPSASPDPFAMPGAVPGGLNLGLPAPNPLSIPTSPAAVPTAAAPAPFVAPPIVAPAPSRRISPVAVGMIVMFACSVSALPTSRSRRNSGPR